MKKVLLLIVLVMLSSNASAFEWRIKALENSHAECGDGRKALLIMDKDAEGYEAFVCIPQEQLLVIMKNLGISQESYLPGTVFNEELAMRSSPAKELVNNLIEYHVMATELSR